MKLIAVQGLRRSLRMAWDILRGRPPRRRAADRNLLERCILPDYARRCSFKRVLFVGCARYTQHYEQFFPGVEYWTIDPSTSRRRWGGRRHIRAGLQELDRHVPADTFDLIVCNGVLGWGLNRRADVERAFAACHRALAHGGELVVGWNDIWPRNRIKTDDIAALAQFERCGLPEFAAPRVAIDVPHKHVFDFYRKPDVGAVHAVSVVGASDAGAQTDSGWQTLPMQRS